MLKGEDKWKGGKKGRKEERKLKKCSYTIDISIRINV